MRRASALFFSLILFLCFTQKAYSWGSVDTGQSAFATHQFLNKKAYKELRRNSALEYSGFPSLEDIQRHSGVSAPSKRGLGPDDPERSDYDWHWYNPSTGKGKTPDMVEHFYNLLKEGIAQQNAEQASGQALEELAHNAAYTSHFIQDMTCPFHVFGIPKAELNPLRVGTEAEVGPYLDNLIPERWKKLVEIYLEDTHHGSNYFDATYYDGVWPATTMTSSHFEYEAMVEIKYKTDITSRVKWAYYAKRYGYVSNRWKNGMDLKNLTHEVAKYTRYRIGDRNSPGDLWIDVSRLKRDTEIPYFEWWRAVQLTYTLWRSTFSALHSQKKDVKLVKTANQPNAYKLKVNVWNWEEKRDAMNVKVEYEIKGKVNAKGSGAAKGSIKPHDSSDWFECSGEINMDDPEKRDGKLILTITGKYSDPNFPDSGEKVVEYDLKDIAFEAIKLDDVRGSHKDSAQTFLEGRPRFFKVEVSPAGEAPEAAQNNLVKEQDPQPGTWVASGDTIRLKAYGEFLISVPKVIGLDKTAATKLISDVGLTPAPGEILVEHTEVENIVKTQTPSEGKLKPKEKVTFLIAKRKPAPPPEPPQSQPADQGGQNNDDYDLPLTPVMQDALLGDIQMSPASTTIKLGQGAQISAIPIDIEGNKVRGNDLDRFSYNWIVNDPSIANVSGAGRSGHVSGIKPGTVQVVVTGGGAMGIATVVIEDAEVADNWDQQDALDHYNFQNNSGFSSGSNSWTSGASTTTDVNSLNNQQNLQATTPVRGSQNPYRPPQNNYNNTRQQQQQQQQNFQNAMNMLNAFGQAMNNIKNVRNNNRPGTCGDNCNNTRNQLPTWTPPPVGGPSGGGNDPLNSSGYSMGPRPPQNNSGGGTTRPPQNTSGNTGGSRPPSTQDPNAIILLDQVAPPCPNPTGNSSSSGDSNIWGNSSGGGFTFNND